MPATLLVADPKWTWRDWLKSDLADRDFVCLDLSDADHGPPGRVFVLQKGKVRAWRLVGSVHAQRNPTDLLVGALDMLSHAGRDPVVLTFQMRETPVLRQMALALAEAVKPAEILVPEGSAFLHEPWPVATQTVTIETALPENARAAQRRARWLEMLESCVEHEVELDHVGLMGVRLGSGRRLHGAPFDELGVRVESYGSTLLVVSEKQIDEVVAGEALNLAHATNLALVAPTAYDGLLCSFVRGTGEDFGIGVIKSIDFASRTAAVLNTAVAPAPVRALRIGSLRIDSTGKETGETRPWAV